MSTCACWWQVGSADVALRDVGWQCPVSRTTFGDVASLDLDSVSSSSSLAASNSASRRLQAALSSSRSRLRSALFDPLLMLSCLSFSSFFLRFSSSSPPPSEELPIVSFFGLPPLPLAPEAFVGSCLLLLLDVCCEEVRPLLELDVVSPASWSVAADVTGG